MYKDKIILVTGASKGIGKAIIDFFAKQEATIIMTARDIKSYKSSRKGVGTDLYLLENLVSEERYKANYRVAEYKAIKLSKTPKNKVEG